MKFSSLLLQRPALLRQAHLANLAFAYAKLSEITARITRARLHGSITLKQAAPGPEPCGASLSALEGNQSVVEEHFTDADLADFADVLAFVTGETQLDLTFRIEETAERFIAPLRHLLEQAGVIFDHAAQPVGEPNRGGPAG